MTNQLEDLKVNVKVKLSALWITLMFSYSYADVLGFYSPGNLAEILTGEIAGVPLTQEMLVAMAILMAIPIVMVFLSLLLMPKVNRILNIIAGIAYIVVLLATFLGPLTAYYLVLASIELVCLVLIVWFAFKWPEQE
ncbi:MAG: hypothetical protein JSW05_03455 [Candidatus Thorarchaeota archaeon]|nr:MAG: hypothetical protein JSW05_03455 [Candidatus Thorarchaeota archaeon]